MILAILRLAGYQHYGFHEYKDPHGNRLFADDANGSVFFNWLRSIGSDQTWSRNGSCVDCDLDGTFLKKESLFDLSTVSTVYDIVPYIALAIHDIVYDIVCDLVRS